MQSPSNSPQQRAGNRTTSLGAKRKLSEHESGEPPQRTISEFLSSQNQNGRPAAAAADSNDQHPTTANNSNKRFRASPPPTGSSSSKSPDRSMSSDKMYSFSSGPQPKTTSTTTTTTANSNGPTLRQQQSPAAAKPGNFTPQTGAKRLVVKNLRSGPKLNQDAYFEKVWTQLQSALETIFDHGKPATSLEELYKGAENVCRQGRAERLAKKLQERCNEYVSTGLRSPLVAGLEEQTNVQTLRAVINAWATWSSKLVTIRWIFYYLDQSFLLHSKDFPVINEMGLQRFHASIFSDPALKTRILQGACDLIEADRKNELDEATDDRELLKKSIRLFHDLGVYSRDFEPLLVQESQRFFKQWAEKEASSQFLATYAENCHNLIEREIQRCELYDLTRRTQQKLSSLLDDSLIREQQSVLLKETDIFGLLAVEDKYALGRIYSLLERLKLGQKLKPIFHKYIEEHGTMIVFDEEREADMVVRLLEFKEKLDTLLSESFQRDEELSHTLREAFEVFMNKGRRSESNWNTTNPKTGEMIAKYVDMLLKGGVKVIGLKPNEMTLADEDAEINKQLDRVLELFRFVQGKDVFEAFYKNDLARRLLMGRSASDEAEKGMLARLKTECGAAFTQNLESMFRDMDIARDEMSSYNAIQRERADRPPLDLNVSVLSSASWPTYPDVPVRIPPDIARALNDFEQYYKSKHSGRTLSWKHQLAHCQLRARFPKGDKEIVVSSFQAIVLLLFNDVPEGGTLSYGQIKEATGLSDRELKRTLQSLACAKYRVLTKRPKGRDVNETDEFAYNAGFTDPKMRIKINQIQLKETKEENKTTHERVAADRHFETQAAIVRIMKSRKVITHAELVAEVIKATRSRGVLEPSDIKKNIEKLIEKDYMERVEGNKYSYLA